MRNSITTLILTIFAVCGMAACNNPTPDPGPTNQLVLSVDKAKIAADSVATATFTVTFNGQVVTGQAGCVINKGTETLQGNKFASNVMGSYQFRATYNGINSNEVTVQVGNSDSTIDYMRKTTVLYVTSTGCQFCPIGSKVVQDGRKHYSPYIVPLYFHVQFGSPSDPLITEYGKAMEKWIQSTGLPGIRANNAVNLPNGQFDLTDLQLFTLGNHKKSNMGLAIETQYDTQTRKLKCVFKMKMGTLAYRNENLKLVAWYTEDGIVATQNNNGIFDSQYIHYDVVRDLLIGEGIFGVNVPAEYLGAIGKEYTREVSFDVPTGWDTDKSFVNFYVYHSRNKSSTTMDTLINVQRVQVGKKIDYELLNE